MFTNWLCCDGAHIGHPCPYPKVEPKPLTAEQITEFQKIQAIGWGLIVSGLQQMLKRSTT